jgi:hypothetical protein
MTEHEQLAREAIEKTLAACTQAGDSRKADTYAACFAENGVLELMNARYEGREAIRAFMAAPSVVPQPSYEAARPTSPGLDHNGYYDDRFVCLETSG